jgi:hypothetical protein
MGASGDPLVRAAQLASLALGAADAGYSYLLTKPGSLAERVMGPSSGAWHEWGVGLLASAAAIHGRAVLAPSERSMAAVALLRATVAPGHASLLVLEPGTRRRSVGLLAMNLTAAALSWTASRRLAGR